MEAKTQIINILLIDNNKADLDSLYHILRSPGNNIFRAQDKTEALTCLQEKNIAMVLCAVDIEGINFYDFIDSVSEEINTSGMFVIATANNGEHVYNLVKGMKKGVTDYLLKPFVPNLVKAKIDVYKRIYFKNKRITNLLENILPKKTLLEFNKLGKSTPKKIKNCSVLFTDFVGFSDKSTKLSPNLLIKKLDYYFSKFDEIIHKYQLEKIKTIGDAYMAVGGVGDSNELTELKTALAAIEIRNFMDNEISTRQAIGKDHWDIRIGIHTGDLVAGVIGKHKFSFDVWGDTVNVAARCEQNSIPNKINISVDFKNKIKSYFDFTPRGEIKIKNRGSIEMFFLEAIKPEYSLYHNGKKANAELRQLAQLPVADFDGFRTFIIAKLKAELSEDLFYHSIDHTLNVEQAALKYAELEGLDSTTTSQLQTAALFHDAGFLVEYDNNEHIGVKILNKYAFEFGYSEMDLKIIGKIILATNNKVTPVTLAEQIMCDADHDYLGRKDYHHVAKKLHQEMCIYKKELHSKEWIQIQIDYLENKHQYFTTSAYNLRQQGKENRIQELKERLAKL
jgi:class 3 adenylate cyclase/CheY-like chemotaxis protein/HD superfamily phosphodiesterase